MAMKRMFWVQPVKAPARFLILVAGLICSHRNEILAQTPSRGFQRAPLVSREPFGWVPFRSEDMVFIRDAEIEADVRLEMIRHARHTIDFVTYAQMPDNGISLPFLTALREAADRGVHIRYLSNEFQRSMTDVTRRTARYLLNPATRAPIEVLYMGGITSPFGIFNYVHEKFLIIDNKIAMTAGRPVGNQNLRWLDKAFVYKGPLVLQATEVFERIWDFSSRFRAPRFNSAQSVGLNSRAGMNAGLVSDTHSEATALPESPLHPYVQWLPSLRYELDDVQATEAARIKSWLPLATVAPSSLGDSPENTESKARMMHNDLLQQVYMSRFPGSREARLAVVEDPVIDAMVARLDDPNVQNVTIACMTLIMHPRLKAKLIEVAMRRRADGSPRTIVTLFTNSRNAVRWLVSAPVNYDYALVDTRDMLRAGIHIAGFFTADPRSRTNIGREDSPWLNAIHQDWTYLHEKVAVIDDTLYMGSHNFNLPSSIYNDEATAEIRDQEWASRIRANLFEEMRLHSAPITLEEVNSGIDAGGLGLAISRLFGEFLMALF